jgi:hypothetical protein
MNWPQAQTGLRLTSKATQSLPTLPLPALESFKNKTLLSIEKQRISPSTTYEVGFAMAGRFRSLFDMDFAKCSHEEAERQRKASSEQVRKQLAEVEAKKASAAANEAAVE